MKRWLVVVAVVGACKKDGATPVASTPSPSGPQSTAEVDALWAMAPAGAIGGMVASPRAVAMLEHGWQDVHSFAKTLPAFAPAESELAKSLGEIGLTTEMKLADLGLAPGKGFAYFFVSNDDGVVLLSLADRDKFLGVVKGTKGADGVDQVKHGICKTANGWYACGTKSAIDTLGKGDLRGKLDVVKARGDVEMVMEAPAKIAAVLQLDRGAFVARGIVGGVPQQVSTMLGAPVKPRVDLDHAAGFAVFNLEPLLKDVPEFPIVEGVTAADLAKNVGGPLTATIAAGSRVIDARVPLKDPEPAKKVIAKCTELPGMAMLGAKLEKGACHIPVPQYDFAVDVWVDGKELHVGTRDDDAKSGSAPVSAIGAELAKGTWQLAFWGHGTLVAQKYFGMPTQEMTTDQIALLIRVMTMIDEVGLGLTLEGDSVRFVVSARTAWANPDDVVAKLQAVPIDAILGGKAGQDGKAIADAAPNSPFAADYKAGSGGVMIPVAAIGIIAAVAIPAFLDYMKKSKPSEAAVHLNAIGKAAKRYYIENATFPAGDAAATPDFPTCCGLKSAGGVVDNKCPNSPSAWKKDKIWSALEFEIDEPTMYRYTYHSDGKTALVTAIGDLDCDGNFATFELHVDTKDGNPTATLVKPPNGTY